MSSSILGLISRKIAPKSLVLGRLSCRKFCKLLRPAAAPCLMLPPTFTRMRAGEFDMAYNLYSPTKGKVVSFSNRGGGKEEADFMRSNDTILVGSSHGWLAMFNSRTCDLFLTNPLSGRRIDLPPLAGKPFWPGEKELLPPWKVIISCSPDDDDEQNCRAIIILGKCDRAAICLPGRSHEWAPFDEWPTVPCDLRLYVDFVYSAARGRFFGLVQSGWCFKEELEGWEISIDNKDSSLCQRMDRLHRFSRPYFNSNRNMNTNTNKRATVPARYLVYDEQSDQLFLVRRFKIHRDKVQYDVSTRSYLVIDREKIDYDVYRLDDVGGIELCSSLDDLAMFVGLNHSFAVKASKFPGLKPNSIYFSDARDHMIDDLTSQTIEIFDYRSKTCSPVYYLSRHLNNRLPIPWFTPTSD